MSGGSLDYAYSKEFPPLQAYEDAQAALIQLAAEETDGRLTMVVEYLASLIVHLRLAQRMHDDSRMRETLRAIEWHLSGDSGPDQAREEILIAWTKRR